MKRILFITTPTITIFQKKAYQELGFGASLVAGSLENRGFEVSFYDFNAALTKIRDDRYLTDWEKGVLSDVEILHEELKNPGRAENLQGWISELIGMIDESPRYDCIAFSMDIKLNETYFSRGSVHFATLLASRLKKIFPVPVFAGGREMIRELGERYIHSLFDKISEFPIQSFFVHKAHDHFPIELKLYGRGEGQLWNKERFIRDVSSFKTMNIVPKYDVKNLSDIYASASELFPEEILARYPTLKEQAPITIVPYRHSMGCPYKCNFCGQGEDPLVKIHEVEDIVHTLIELKKKGFENYRWYNDNLNLGPIFPAQLADKIIECKIDILFSDSANLKHTSLPLFKKLREAGCIKLWFGSETMSPQMLKRINKSTTVEDLHRTLSYTNATGIWSGLNIIVAFPHETEADFQMTLDFMRNNREKYDCFGLNIFRLISGTSYDKEPEKHGIRIRQRADNLRISAYDEIGGMMWEDRLRVAKDRFNRILDIVPGDLYMLLQNDYILYFLTRAGFSRLQIRDFIQELFDFYLQKNNTQFIAGRLGYSVAEDRKIYIGESIMGRVIASVALSAHA